MTLTWFTVGWRVPKGDSSCGIFLPLWTNGESNEDDAGGDTMGGPTERNCREDVKLHRAILFKPRTPYLKLVQWVSEWERMGELQGRNERAQGGVEASRKGVPCCRTLPRLAYRWCIRH